MSRSRKVNTVSRCMCARSLVITAAITRSAAPLAKRFLAICSIMRAWVRPLMPMSTVPLPIGITSPPSSDEAEVLGVEAAIVPQFRYQNSKLASWNIGW